MRPRAATRWRRCWPDLPAAVFTADDGLGWVYQFWQSKKKDEVNASERKIGGADLAPVTQLFTEDYMVRFLLQNTLGAWWAARHPDSPLIEELEYLRWMDEVEGGRGAGGGGRDFDRLSRRGCTIPAPAPSTAGRRRRPR